MTSLDGVPQPFRTSSDLRIASAVRGYELPPVYPANGTLVERRSWTMHAVVPARDGMLGGWRS